MPGQFSKERVKRFFDAPVATFPFREGPPARSTRYWGASKQPRKLYSHFYILLEARDAIMDRPRMLPKPNLAGQKSSYAAA